MNTPIGDPPPPGWLPWPMAAPQTGWICPRCNVVKAPSVQECHCNTMLNGPTCMRGGIAGDG